MKPIPLTITVPAFTFTCEAAVSEDAANQPAEDCEELKILDRYAGIWVEHVSGKPEVRRRDEGEWILDGRFLRQTWTSEAQEDAPKASGMTLMTYDREQGVYRSWAFLATGSVIENEGSWDEPTKTMTWGHRVPETTEMVFTRVVFPDEATQEWSIVKTDGEGKILRELAGRSIRQEKA
jgi:hypothetical protein